MKRSHCWRSQATTQASSLAAMRSNSVTDVVPVQRCRARTVGLLAEGPAPAARSSTRRGVIHHPVTHSVPLFLGYLCHVFSLVGLGGLGRRLVTGETPPVQRRQRGRLPASGWDLRGLDVPRLVVDVDERAEPERPAVGVQPIPRDVRHRVDGEGLGRSRVDRAGLVPRVPGLGEARGGGFGWTRHPVPHAEGTPYGRRRARSAP